MTEDTDDLFKPAKRPDNMDLSLGLGILTFFIQAAGALITTEPLPVLVVVNLLMGWGFFVLLQWFMGDAHRFQHRVLREWNDSLHAWKRSSDFTMQRVSTAYNMGYDAALAGLPRHTFAPEAVN